MQSKDLVNLDTPMDLVLSSLERDILEGLASAKSPKDISTEMGIPRAAIMTLLRKPGVKDFVQELVDARNQLMKMYLPDLLMNIIEDKVVQNEENEDSRLADLSRKDVVDIAKQLDSLLKTTGGDTQDEAEDKMTKLYQQINVIQNGDKG